MQYFEQKLEFEIDASDLHKLMHAGEDVVVIDMRSAERYEEEHISGSINLPHATIDSVSTNDYSRASLYVSYCDGVGCNASTKGALRLAALGFRVKELTGGLRWWCSEGLPTGGHLNNRIQDKECAC